MLEEHAAQLGMQLHFFILNADAFREGRNIAISDESSGNTQHHLLLEEFYRTGLLLAGRPPLWWIIPPEHLYHYREYSNTLLRQRFVRAGDWLDFGGLEDARLGEFFSAAHWQLFKGIALPYKSLLKLLLFEAFASRFPEIHWYVDQIQARYHGQQEISAIDVDPYLLMMEHIETHLKKTDQQERLRLARRALYLKSGVRLSTSQQTWKTPVFRQLCADWGWDEGELINLDQHRNWKLDQVMEERNQLVGELSRSYRLLTTLAREHQAADGIDMRELSLLGRKLFSALERRPGKIDLVNPGLSDNLHQKEIWIRRHPGTRAWRCYLSDPEADTVAVKSAISIVELLLWLSANGVIDNSTRIDLPAEEAGATDQEHQRLLRVLQQRFPPAERHSASLGAYAKPPQGQRALIIINALQPVRSHPDGLLTVSRRADPLSFGTRRSNLIASIDYVHANSWGELHATHQAGSSGLLEILSQHLNLFYPQAQSGSLVCHCDTPGHGATIANRISQLGERMLGHFQRHGSSARYVLQIGEEFHVLSHQQRRFSHHPLGNRDDLLDYLGESDGRFHNTEIDAAGLEGSALPLVTRLNRPGRIQLCYKVERSGIQSFLLDSNGALLEQWHANTPEPHFLIHHQRFFNTLQDWQYPVTVTDTPPALEFLRLQRTHGDWQVQTVAAPGDSAQTPAELLLSTGAGGPWSDGFSLLSSGREFNSVELGEQIYREVAAYLTGLRRDKSAYPLYLTGVVSTGASGEPSLSLVDLMRFKRRIERRLNAALDDKAS